MNTENSNNLPEQQEYEPLLLIDDHEEEVSEGGRRVRRKGIFLLPNLLTTGALFAGFFAVISAMNAEFHNACMAIVAAMFLDGLDGRMARLTNTQSAFGAEYDSLSDLLAFGVAPALICFSWALSSLGTLGWTAAFFYVACAALRLARFNIQLGTVSKRFFVGLASPAAAGLVVFMVWVCDEYSVTVSTPIAIVAAMLTMAAGLLMVLNIHYYSFKDMDFKNRVPFFVILMVILLFVIISWDPPVVLFIMALLYAASGPVMKVYQHRHKREGTKEAASHGLGQKSGKAKGREEGTEAHKSAESEQGGDSATN